MSHRIVVQVVIRDRDVVLEACRRLGYTVLGEGTYRMYSTPAKGLGISVPGFSYPVVWDPETGQFSYDNWNTTSMTYAEVTPVTRLIHECTIYNTVAELRDSGVITHVGETEYVDGEWVTDLEVIQ